MFVVRSPSFPELCIPALKTSTLITDGQENLATGQHLAALKYFDQALSQAGDAAAPLTEQAQVGRAHALFELGRDDEAQHCLAQLQNPQPDSAATALHEAEMLFALGRHEAAENTLLNAHQRHPTNIEILRKLTLLSMQHSNLDEALMRVGLALVVEPLNTDILHLQGCLLSLQGEHEDGLKSLANAVRENPAKVDAVFKYGRGLAFVGRHTEAQHVFSHALALDPHNPKVLLQYGRTLVKLSQVETAIEVLTLGVSFHPMNRELVHYRALACLVAKRFDQCLADCNFLVQIEPDWCAGFNLRGVLHLTRDEPWLALPDFKQAITLAPDNARIRINQARALLCLDQGKKAQASLNAARKLAPADPELRALTHWLQDRREGEAGPHLGDPVQAAHYAYDSAPGLADNPVANPAPDAPRKRKITHGKPPLPPEAKHLRVAQRIRLSHSAPQLTHGQDLAALSRPPSHWVPV